MSRTFEALRQAEKSFEGKFLRERPYGNIESNLAKLGLGKEHILKQNYSQLKQSLNLSDSLLKKHIHFLNLHTDNSASSKILGRRILLKTLLIRREYILGRLDKLIIENKFKIIIQLVKKISDNQIRLAIEDVLKDLKVKDDFFMKEYEKMAHVEKKLEE